MRVNAYLHDVFLSLLIDMYHMNISDTTSPEVTKGLNDVSTNEYNDLTSDMFAWDEDSDQILHMSGQFILPRSKLELVVYVMVCVMCIPGECLHIVYVVVCVLVIPIYPRIYAVVKHSTM